MADAPALKPVYLLTGSDRPKIETALGRLRRHFAPEATELVSAQEVSGAEAAALCNAGSLFGDARLVLVEGVDGRRSTEGRLANGWKAADVKAIEEYLASPAPGTVLALVARGAEEGRRADEGLREGGRGAGLRRRQEEDRLVGRRALQAGRRAGRARGRRGARPARRRGPAPARERGRQARPLGRRRADRRGGGGAARRGGRGDADVRAHRRLRPARHRPHARRDRDDLRARGAAAPRHGAAARRGARQPPRLHAALPAARVGGSPGARRGDDPEAAPVLRREGVRAGGELLGGGAARRGRPSGGARSRAQGRHASSRPTSSSSEP